MKSPHGFVVKPPSLYINTKIIGDKEIVINSDEESATYVRRECEVIEVPTDYTGPIEKGDIIIVHHNVLRPYLSQQGRRVSSGNHFGDGYFVVEIGLVYAYKRADSHWVSLNGNVFVAPALSDNTTINKNTTYEPLHGVIFINTPYLEGKGIKQGDAVVFRPDSEYQFRIEDNVYYKMNENKIVCRTTLSTQTHAA